MEFNKETLKIIKKVAEANGGWDNIPGVSIKSSNKIGDCDKIFLSDSGFVFDERYDNSEDCWVLLITKNK